MWSVCTASENHLSEDGQDSVGPQPPWKVAGTTFPSALHSAPYSSALANGGQEGERYQSGKLDSSQNHKSFIPDSWLSWLTEGMAEGRSYHWSWKIPLAIARCLKSDPRELNVLPGTSARNLKRSGPCKINVFEHVFCRSLSELLFPLNEIIWGKITLASAKDNLLCYFFSPSCAVFAKVSWCKFRTRGCHSSEESQQLQQVFLDMPGGLAVSQWNSCSGRLFSSGLLDLLEPLSLLKMALDNSAKAFLVVSKVKNPPLGMWTQSDSGSKDAAPGFPLCWGFPSYFSRKTKGERWKSLQFMALNETCTGHFLLVWGLSQEGPAPQVWSSLCTERAGLQGFCCSNVMWLRLCTVGQKE